MNWISCARLVSGKPHTNSDGEEASNEIRRASEDKGDGPVEAQGLDDCRFLVSALFLPSRSCHIPVGKKFLKPLAERWRF